jgi:hypothetical protein
VTPDFSRADLIASGTISILIITPLTTPYKTDSPGKSLQIVLALPVLKDEYI